MWNYIWPVLMVVGANTVYNIAAKSTPGGVNAFASLTVTYLTAAAVSLLMFFASPGRQALFTELRKINWTAFAFGIAIVALEFGYINIYRAGWKMSVASLAANIALACVLLLVGILLYKETVSLRQLAGVAVCAAGLFLIAK